MGAVPSQIRICEEHKVNPLFGIEFYYQPLHPGKSEFQTMDQTEKNKIKKSYHLTAIAHNETGFKNLLKASSWGWREGFYYKPRINHKILSTHTEGITFFSGCYMSEVGQAFDRGGAELADEKIREYIKLFKENFYLEIMLLDFVKQKPYNKYIVDAAARFNLPIVVTQDCHYCNQEDSKYQTYMLMIQKGTTIADIERKLASDDKAEIFEHQDKNLWFKSEEELNQKYLESYQDIIPLDVFNMAKENTVKIAQKSQGIKIDRSMKLPFVENADEKLKEKVIEGMKARRLYDKKEYQKQIIEEIDLIKRKGFSSYFLIQKNIVDEARRISPSILGYGDGSEALGVGRGSAVGSLVCYCLGITDVDPIKNNLLFSRFLSESRGGKTLRTKFKNPPINA
jgi:DNA polymerase-3 subunit alpha